MSRVFDFSSWSPEAIRARLAELRAARASIEAEELALIAALENLRRPFVGPGSSGTGDGSGEGSGDDAEGSGAGSAGSAGSGSGDPVGSSSPEAPRLDFSPGSAVEVLTEEAQMSSRSAMAMVSLAVALEGLPLIGEAFGAGEISREIAQEIAKFATSETEAEILEAARCWSVSDAIRNRRAALAITKVETAAIHRSRELRLRWNKDRDSVEIFGRLTAEGGAKLDAALGRIMSSIPDKVAGKRVPYKSRLADALVELAGFKIASDADTDRATVSLHIDYEALVRSDSNAEIHTGIGVGYVSADIARRITCDPRLEIVLDGPDGLALGVGRRTRQVPSSISREIRYRDKACIHPGCERTYGLEAHHIIHWADGGPTDYDNLALLCFYHHQMVHEQGWSLTGTIREGLVFEGIWGERIEVAPWEMRTLKRKRPPTRVHVGQ